MTESVLTRLRSTLDVATELPEGLSKVWIYKGRILAADYRSPSGVAFAFDISVEDSVLQVAVAPRDDRSRDIIREACGELLIAKPGTTKFSLASAHQDSQRVAEELLEPMRKAHRAILSAEVARSGAVDEGTWEHDGVPVNYVRRAPKSDCDQILVIFTSIRTVATDLDFDGPEGRHLASNRAELVFIHDDYDEAYCYYYGTRRDDQVARAVTAFVRHLAQSRGVGLDRVVLAGMSKGGAAALIVGARLPGATVVALVPQMAIGSYLSGRSEPYLETIAGSRTSESVAWLDGIVPQAMSDAANREGHFYVLTGPGDANCFEGLVDRAGTAARFPHLNVIAAVSAKAVDHFGTLKYLLPTMISLLGVLSSGARPDLGLVSTTSGRGVGRSTSVGRIWAPGPLRTVRLRRALSKAQSLWREAATTRP